MINTNKRLKLIKKIVRKKNKASGKKPAMQVNIDSEFAPQEWDLREELDLMGTRLKG